jgi:DNA-binding beta-propeller fold protein YncE
VVCTSDQVTCNGQCVALASDPANCGTCGRACGAGQSCSAGLCCEGSQCPPALYAACFNASSVQGATAALAPVGSPVQVESGPIAFAWQGTALWVANSISNTLDRLAVSPAGLAPSGALPTLRIPVSGPFADLEYLAEWNGLLYASNAAVGSLLVVDPSDLSVREVPLGSFSFPQGIAFTGNKAYVALNALNAVAVVDLATRTLTRTIDLSAQSSPGGSPLPSRLAVKGTRLYVTLWNLDPTFSPAGNGLLAVIDTTTDALVPGASPVDLGTACQDPGGLAFHGDTLWVTCGFFAYNGTTVTGSAFVPVDVSGPVPVVRTPVPVAGAAPGALAFCGDVGYAGDRFSGKVLRLDPSTGSVAAQGLVCAASASGSRFVADVACGR